MSEDYKGLIKGNLSVIEIAKTIATLYGGDQFKFRFGNESIEDYGFGLGRGIDSGHYIIVFDQELSDEAKKLRPWERKPHRVGRMMHVFTDGYNISDYREINAKAGDYTYISLGNWGEAKEIINTLVAHYGGYARDEGGNDEWEALTPEALQEANDRISKRLAYIAERDASHAARRLAEDS